MVKRRVFAAKALPTKMRPRKKNTHVKRMIQNLVFRASLVSPNKFARTMAIPVTPPETKRNLSMNSSTARARINALASTRRLCFASFLQSCFLMNLIMSSFVIFLVIITPFLSRKLPTFTGDLVRLIYCYEGFFVIFANYT